MIVHLTASSRTIGEDRPYLRAIVTTIHSEGHVLARDWIELANNREIVKSKEIEVDWEVIFKDNIQAISRADVVIVEATSYGFSQGFQVATALQQKKPTLLLCRESSVLKDHFGSGVTDELLTVRQYRSNQDLEDIVAQFLEDNTLTTKDMRFNFFIDRQIYNYLRWASAKTGKTKSELLRSLLEKEIERQEETS